MGEPHPFPPVRRWPAIPFLAGFTAIVLLCTGLFLIANNEASFKARQASQLRVQADIVAASVTAALAFDDVSTAREYIAAMRANPEIEAAGVYDRGGALVAGYSRTRQPALPRTVGHPAVVFQSRRLVAVRPVVEGSTHLGYVYLKAFAEPFVRRATRYAVIALLVTLTSLVLGAISGAHGALTRANASLADANQRLRLEMEEREKAEAALRQSQKMEAVGQLTGGIAHDFNNMLAVVIGSLDLLSRRIGGEDARARSYVEAATEAARRAALLTQRLLAFSRQQPLKPAAVDPNALVSGIFDLLQRSLGGEIRLETALADGVWPTYADPHQLENVLLNLALNGRDAMPSGGSLTIETCNVRLEDAGAAELGVRSGEYVLLAVADTGSGMSPEVLAKAFEPFFTTKEVGKGTGLGLSQVYGFAKQSGGGVKIDSTPGQGATVKVYLPRLVREAAEAAQTGAGRELARGGRELVLVVEDEPTVRRFATEALDELGYQVLEADGAAAALRVLDVHPEIVLLFTDVVMPDTNGPALAEQARRRRPGLKVLFTTGYARDAMSGAASPDSGDAVITKPFTIEELSAKVREVLDRPVGAVSAG